MDGTIPIILVLIIVVPIILLTLFVFVRLFSKAMIAGKKTEEPSFDIGPLYDALGGKENIEDTKRDMSRITVTLKDIELINKDLLQNLGVTGVLLVGNQVKLNFKDKAEEIEQLMK
jgi:phosphotransferase system IIB component